MNLQQAKTLRTYVRKSLSDYAVTEGGTSPEEMMYLANLIGLTDIRYVAEIGLNTGYSAHAMLGERHDVRVVSFDIGSHTYIEAAKKLIDDMYPGRHRLILGNSTLMVPNYADMEPVEKFDMAFIDGGHSLGTAFADICNMRRICKSGAIVVMDDTTPFRHYGKGPYKAWEQAIWDGIVEHSEYVQDGITRELPTKTGTHVWAAGFYK